MKNGFIYPIINRIVQLLWWLNIVEYVKRIFAKVYGLLLKRDLQTEEIITAKNIAIDTFTITKWLLVLIFIGFGVATGWAFFVIWYLIVANLFTYFYYHVWGSGYEVRRDIESQRRRFVNFLLSIAFYIVCYAYLYQFQFSQSIAWSEPGISTANAIYLSIGNALALTFVAYEPLNQSAWLVFASEAANTFFFLVIIIVNSVPASATKE